jgi:hypothetical protein
MFEQFFIRKYVKDDMYHGVSREFATKRATLTWKLNSRQISAQEYHRQMDSVHAKHPDDWQKIQASGGHR